MDPRPLSHGSAPAGEQAVTCCASARRHSRRRRCAVNARREAGARQSLGSVSGGAVRTRDASRRLRSNPRCSVRPLGGIPPPLTLARAGRETPVPSSKARARRGPTEKVELRHMRARPSRHVWLRMCVGPQGLAWDCVIAFPHGLLGQLAAVHAVVIVNGFADQMNNLGVCVQLVPASGSPSSLQ